MLPSGPKVEDTIDNNLLAPAVDMGFVFFVVLFLFIVEIRMLYYYRVVAIEK